MISPFITYCKATLPTVFGDELSYYETLCSLTNFLNDVIIPQFNELEKNTNDFENDMTNKYNELLAVWKQLQEWVTGYFDNLDVQEEINMKLDEMAQSGELRNIMEPFFTDIQQSLSSLQNQVNSLVLNAGSPEQTAAEIEQARNGRNLLIQNIWDIEASSNQEAQFILSGNINLTDNTISITGNSPILFSQSNFIVLSGEKTASFESSESRLTLIIARAGGLIRVVRPVSPFYSEFLRPFDIILAAKYQSNIIFKSAILSISSEEVENQITSAKEKANTLQIKLRNIEGQSGRLAVYGTTNVSTFKNGFKLSGGFIGSESIFKIVNEFSYEFVSQSGMTAVIINNTNEIQEVRLKSSATYSYLDNIVPSGSVILAVYNNNLRYYCPYIYKKLKVKNNYLAINNNIYGNKLNIFLGGDSITHGVGGSNFAQNGEHIITVNGREWKRNPNGYCWANLFKNYIESYCNYTVTNNACTGTNIQFWGDNIDELLPAEADVFLLTVGTNNRVNTYNTAFNTFNNYVKIIKNYCDEINCKLIMFSPIPASAANENNENNYPIHIFQIDNILQYICNLNNITYVDIYNELLIYYNTNTLPNSLYADGLHPNDKLYFTIFMQYLKSLKLNIPYNLSQP